MPDDTGWNILGVQKPWSGRPSLYRHVLAHAEAAGASPLAGAYELPDEALFRSEGSLGWVPGAQDSLTGGAAREDAEGLAEEIRDALVDLTEESTDANAARLYDLLSEGRAVEYVDPLLEVLGGEGLDAGRVRGVARWLATESPDREPVKAGIVLLGAFPDGDDGGDRDALLALGRHEEFTAYAAVALLNSGGDDAERALCGLASSVCGWGRVNIVERLAATRDDAVRAWMLREGYRNDVMYEYTAHVCATTGGLLEALEAPDPDRALIEGAGNILAALMDAFSVGGVEDIFDYDDGPEAAGLYLAHAERHEVSVEQVVALARIRRFLTEDLEQASEYDLDPEERHKVEAALPEWGELRGEMLERIGGILARPELKEAVLEGLEAPLLRAFATVEQAASVVGVDSWPHRFERHRGGEENWYQVMQTDDPDRVEAVLELAEERLPLGEIAAGRVEKGGPLQGFEHELNLTFLLQGLIRWPGYGWPVVETGLKSPSARNRTAALRVLAAWGRGAWPADAEGLLRRSLEQEDDRNVRYLIRKVLAGDSSDPW